VHRSFARCSVAGSSAKATAAHGRGGFGWLPRGFGGWVHRDECAVDEPSHDAGSVLIDFFERAGPAGMRAKCGKGRVSR